MDLLSNLLAFSNNPTASLLFCQSPKELTLDRNTKELRNMMSARKEEIITPEKRTASKSLTKLDLLSFSNTKIDPKERLLHRMVHKVNMKIRKHYYNFFVILENLKKKNVCVSPQKKVSKIDRQKLQNGISKILQLEQILFSKYFSNQMKKSSLKQIFKWSRSKRALQTIAAIFNKKMVTQSFRVILEYSKKMQKQEIRMDILVDSISHIDRALIKSKRSILMQSFMSKLKANLSSYRQSMRKRLQLEYKTPLKHGIDPDQNSIKPFTTMPYSPFSKEKISHIVASAQQNYQTLKSNKKIGQQSPFKRQQPIILQCQQVKLKIQKCYNYLKNTIVKTNLNEQTLPFHFNQEPQYQICKRCEPIPLNMHEIPDINDKGSIFFDHIFTRIPINHHQIAQSSVKILHKKDSQSQVFSQQFHSMSRVTLIAPLSQKHYEQPRKSIASSGVKGSAFGSEAVNFKNSLVVERELMKQQEVERIKQRREVNFIKNKQLLKQEKRIHDEFYQAQSRLKVQGRCQSADRQYTSLKFRKQSDFTITIPQSVVNQSANATSRQVPFIKRNSQTPQPDILRSNYTSQRKHLSLMNNNKVQVPQDDGKRNAGATYLKILSKR